MKLKELLEQLHGMDPELEIMVDGPEEEFEILAAERVNDDERGHIIMLNAVVPLDAG